MVKLIINIIVNFSSVCSIIGVIGVVVIGCVVGRWVSVLLMFGISDSRKLNDSVKVDR